MNCSDLYSDNTTNATLTASLYVKVTGSALFILVWPFIVLDMSFFPLGRPAAALVGATLMVLFHIVPQDEVYEVQGDPDNLRTLFLLVGMMMLSYYFDREGLLNMVTLRIFGKNKPFRTILWKVCVMSALLSAFITNDAACLVITPLLLMEFVNQGRDHSELLPLSLGIATSANIGSAATFFGNPQNAFIASQTGVGLLQFFIAELPAALLGLVTNIGILYLFYFIRSKVSCDGKRTHNGEQSNLLASDDSNEVVSPFTSISQERTQFVMSYDKSINPDLTSQVSIEREQMRSPNKQQYGATNKPIDHSLRFGQSSQTHPAVLNSTSPLPSPNNTQLPSRYRRRSGHRHHTSSGHHSNLSITQEHVLHETSLSYTQFPNEGREEEERQQQNELENVQITQINKFTKIAQKLFIVWLVFISLLVIVLLVIPPQVAHFDLGCIPVAASILTMLMDAILNRKYAYDVMAKIDWAVILMFMGLFVWLRGFQNTTFPCLAFNTLKQHMNLRTFPGVLLFSVFVIIGSNIFSNVPLVILIANQVSGLCGVGNPCEPLAGLLLAWISTIAGNFTLIGSVANLIVAEKVRKAVDYKLSFWSYLVYGFPSTLVILYGCLPVVYFMGKYAASKIQQ